MKVVIIIPTYNEAENIERLVQALEESTQRISDHQVQLLVVDDNSPDGTGEIVKKLQANKPNLFLLSGEKQGLGKAYLRGMEYAVTELGAEIIFEIDADFQHDPRAIPDFLTKIDAGYDFVIGSRYITGGSIPQNWGLGRKILSAAGNLIVRTTLLNFKIHDWTSGYRAIKAWVYREVKAELQSFNGYTFQVAFLNQAQNIKAKVTEVPIQFGEREFGKSKIGGEYVRNLLLYLVSSQIKKYQRFLKFAIVGGTGLVLQTIIFEILGVFLQLTSPSVATILGGQVAIISNYILNNLWTFQDKKITSPLKLAYKFIQFYLTSNFAVIIIQGGATKIGELLVGDNKILIQIFFALGIALTMFWNYFIYNRVVWKTQKKS